MSYKNKNIWALFSLLSFFTLSLTLWVGYQHWKNAYDNSLRSQQKLTQLAAKSTFAVILQYENLLDLIGQKIVAQNTVPNKHKSQQILDHFLTVNPTIASIGLFDIGGKPIANSSNLPPQQDRLKHQLLEYTTQKIITHDNSLTMCRTEFSRQLNELVIPISKVIRNSSGTVIAILTADIKEDLAFSFLQDKTDKTDKTDKENNEYFWLFREKDSYLQFIPRTINKNLAVYQKPLDAQKVHEITSNIERNYQQPIQQIKDRQTVVSYLSHNEQETVLTSAQFIPRYKIWVSLRLPINSYLDNFSNNFPVVISLFILFTGILFLLFYWFTRHSKKLKQHLSFHSDNNPITGLYNRSYLSSHADQILQDNPQGLSYFYINFSSFKTINETHSYKTGNKTLLEIASRLKLLCANDETIVHYSGKEFVVISTQTQAGKLNELAEYFLLWLTKPYQIDSHNILLDLNVGIARYPQDALSLDDLRACAKTAVKSTKLFRNSFSYFDRTAHDKHQRINAIKQQIKTALSNQEFSVLYQPQVDMDNNVYGVEALLRWNNPTLGIIPPAQFIHIAEQNGFIYELGLYAFSQSMLDIKKLQKAFNKPIRLSLNVSLLQITHPTFLSDLIQVMENRQFNAHWVTLELTEKLNIDDYSELSRLIEALKSKGIAIALDNFGSGFANFSLLDKLPIDELKLNPNFIQQINFQTNGANSGQSMIEHSKNLCRSIVAQGIETPAQRDKLKQWGCHLFQGHLFAKAMQYDDLVSYIAQGTEETKLLDLSCNYST